MIVSSNVVIFLRQITRIAQSRTRSVLPLPAAPVRTSAECQNNVTPAQRTRSLSSLSNSYAVTWVWNAAGCCQAASQTLGLRFVCLPSQQLLPFRSHPFCRGAKLGSLTSLDSGNRPRTQYSRPANQPFLAAKSEYQPCPNPATRPLLRSCG